MTTACTAKTEQEQSPHAREWQRVWFIKLHGERTQHEVSSFDTHWGEDARMERRPLRPESTRRKISSVSGGQVDCFYTRVCVCVCLLIILYYCCRFPLSIGLLREWVSERKRSEKWNIKGWPERMFVFFLMAFLLIDEVQGGWQFG